MDNFTALRNGLREHIRLGQLPPFDLGIYTFLHLNAEWTTGIYTGCALTIAYQFGDPRQKPKIQKALRRLRDRKYINYRNGDGTRNGYPILINKYEPTVGELCGTRLNAWTHGELVRADYEPKNGDGTRTVVELSAQRMRHGRRTVGELSGASVSAWKHEELCLPENGPQNGGGTVVERKGNGSRTVVEPIQDLKTLQDLKTYSSELKGSSDLFPGSSPESSPEARQPRTISSLSKSKDSFEQALQEDWDYYLVATKRNPKLYVFTDKRKKLGRARLRECVELASEPKLQNAVNLMKVAIDRFSTDPFHNGVNADGKKYLDWELLCRSREKFMYWLDDGNHSRVEVTQ